MRTAAGATHALTLSCFLFFIIGSPLAHVVSHFIWSVCRSWFKMTGCPFGDIGFPDRVAQLNRKAIIQKHQSNEYVQWPPPTQSPIVSSNPVTSIKIYNLRGSLAVPCHRSGTEACKNTTVTINPPIIPSNNF